MSNDNKVYSVGELISQIRLNLEKQHPFVIVEGEVTNYAKHQGSGHVYFALSENGALLQCVCWKSVKIPTLTDGAKVCCTGKITAYIGRSQFQLNITSVAIQGQGNLFKMFEEMKGKLAAEGLFDQSRKKILTYIPKVIGIITAADGDALQDILARLKDRISCKVIVWPVAVQGARSADMVASAIVGFNKIQNEQMMHEVHGSQGAGVQVSHGVQGQNRPDVLIIARGGGSMEDLWAFNEEQVVRAIASSEIPIVTAIGHEMDYTLADFVSDIRAPTPTASIEILLPTREEIYEKIQKTNMFMLKTLTDFLDKQHQTLKLMMELHEQMVENLYLTRIQQLDYTIEKMDRCIINKIRACKESMPQIVSLDSIVQLTTEKVSHMIDRFNRTILRQHSEEILKVHNLQNIFEGFSYEKVLKRGFCLVTHNAKVIQTATDARQAGQIELQFSDDKVLAIIK